MLRSEREEVFFPAASPDDGDDGNDADHQHHRRRRRRVVEVQMREVQEEEEEEEEQQEEQVIAMPMMWQSQQQQQQQQLLLQTDSPPPPIQPMEPILEEEEDGNGVSPSTSSSFTMVQQQQQQQQEHFSAPAIHRHDAVENAADMLTTSADAVAIGCATNGAGLDANANANFTDTENDTEGNAIGRTTARNGGNDDAKIPTSPDGHRTTTIRESKQRVREVYTTEEIDTLVSTLPKEAIPVEWENFSSEEVVVDPKMAHTYVTELVGGLPSARGSKYSYTYESKLENENEEERGVADEAVEPHLMTKSPEESQQPEMVECRTQLENEEKELGKQVLTGDDGIERHCTSTQKITRVTKITTTRSVKQIPMEPGDIYFDADGNPILNGFDAEKMSPSPATSATPGASVYQEQHQKPEQFSPDSIAATATTSFVDPNVGIDLSRTFMSEHEEQFYSSIPSTSKQASPMTAAPTETPMSRSYNEPAPSAPGVPQVTELSDNAITLAWLSPDFDGNAGPLIGYRVEFRHSDPDEWEAAHDDLLGETECKITNLDPDERYEFRVLGANISGFGEPSMACEPIRLRELQQQRQQRSTQFGTEADYPPPPGRPQVFGIDGNAATIEWRPSLADPAVVNVNDNGMAATNGELAARNHGKQPTAVVVGYLVEYRLAGTSSWLPANDRPIREHRFQVANLRPNGEYEFRVLAHDELGRQSASATSGVVRIRPPAPIRQVNGIASIPIADAFAIPEAPSEPKVLETGPNWVHLHWDRPKPASSFSSPATTSAPVGQQQSVLLQAPLAYLLEIRELGDQMWSQLVDQHVSPTHGDPDSHERVPVTTTMENFIVENLLPDSTGYEFRVWTVSLLTGYRSTRPSPISEPIRLRPPQAGTFAATTTTSTGEWIPPIASASTSRRPPERPSAPEYLDYDGGTSLTLCWLPARSVLPVQGYEVEFRDLMQDATHWYKMTDQLVHICKTSIGYLLNGHQYQFRVLAKNAVSLSEPSDPSPLIKIGVADTGTLEPTVKKHTAQSPQPMMPLMDEMTLVRESPPLPDRDDSPPPIYRQTESSLQWRDPTLKEVIDYLKSPDQTLVLDASGYLQHLTFNNDLIKEETRSYGAIECLISLLRSQNPEILRNVCGCLKNLAFGKTNDINKRLIHQKGGLKALAQLLRTNQSQWVHEEATGTLWNISSADDLKEPVLNQTAETVIQHAVLPYSTLLLNQQPNSSNRRASSTNNNSNQPASQQQQQQNGRNPAANVFRNAIGILRNISAVNDQARRFLRSAPGLVDALLQNLEDAVHRGQYTRSTENIVCLLRNLSYRIQEVVDPKYDPNRSRYQMRDSLENGFSAAPPTARTSERSKSAPSGSPKTGTVRRHGLFRRAGGGGKKTNAADKADEEVPLSIPQQTGPQRLWHPATVRLYLRVLQDCADMEILEASAAAIQNLAGCAFDGSALVRQTVRTEKGLPILVELIRLREDRLVCAVVCALRNLAMDPRNLDLIGKFALSELLVKLPDPVTLQMLQQQPALASEMPSDATLGAVLAILWEAVRLSMELTKAVHETEQGTQRLRTLAKAYPIYSRRVCKYATQVLYMMWQHKELHDQFRQAGLTEADFYSGTLHNSVGKQLKDQQKGQKQQRDQQVASVGKQLQQPQHSPSSMATTLARPFSSQGMERPAHLPLQQHLTTSSAWNNGGIQAAHQLNEDSAGRHYVDGTTIRQQQQSHMPPHNNNNQNTPSPLPLSAGARVSSVSPMSIASSSMMPPPPIRLQSQYNNGTSSHDAQQHYRFGEPIVPLVNANVYDHDQHQRDLYASVQKHNGPDMMLRRNGNGATAITNGGGQQLELGRRRQSIDSWV